MSGEGVLPNRNTLSTRLRRGTITCPVCNHVAAIRDSHQETETVRSLWVACLNVDCGMTWKGQISLTYVLSPSAIEHKLDLPPPPPGYVRQIVPIGPPQDPNQSSIFDMLADDDDEASQAA